VGGLVTLASGAQGVLASAGSGNVPAYTMTPTLTSASVTNAYGASSATVPAFSITGDTNTGFGASAADTAAIWAGGTDVRLSVSGTAVTLGASVALALGDSTSISQGASNRVDLASGDSLNIVSGSVRFNNTDATIGMESSGLKLVANGVGLNVGSAVDGTTWNFKASALTSITTASVDIGASGATMRRFYLGEAGAPSAPAANEVVLFAQDNGGGKTQLMALFSSGVAQQVAIEP
jgi:hypothetical protein